MTLFAQNVIRYVVPNIRHDMEMNSQVSMDSASNVLIRRLVIPYRKNTSRLIVGIPVPTKVDCGAGQLPSLNEGHGRHLCTARFSFD